MKHCSKCNSMYADAGLNFCLSDGTPLTDKPRYDTAAETLRNYPLSEAPKLVITASSRFRANITYPLKLYLDVANTRREPVAIESNSFELSDNLRLQPGIKALPGTTNQYRPRFRVFQTRNEEGKVEDIYKDMCILQPNETIMAFVPIDQTIGEGALAAIIKDKTAGVWRYRGAWFGDRVISRDYEDGF